MKSRFARFTVLALLGVFVTPVVSAAQKTAQATPTTANGSPRVPAGAVLPPGYVIGADDILLVVFWRDKDMSTEVVVRPDGKISVPLINDVHAAGLTPEQLRAQLTEAAGKLIEEPTITVVVKTINSRKVFVTGQVGKPGPYPLSAPTTVLQLLATAGGVLEYADSKEIRIMRTENGKQVSYRFNYKDVIKGKNLKQNIDLQPGDTVIVP
jgi:polysaccharide export outer membrane protein